MKCLECVASRKMLEMEGVVEEDLLEPNDAVTMAPSWQTQTIGIQTAFACVAIPTCYDHLAVSAQTAQQKAMRAGLILGGNGPGA